MTNRTTEFYLVKMVAEHRTKRNESSGVSPVIALHWILS